MRRINFPDPNATRHRRRWKRLRAEDQIREIWRREWDDWKLLTGKELL